MLFINNFSLCYLNSEKLFNWIKENHCEEKNFLSEKEKWQQEINQKPNFFSDTELLIVYQDFLLLKVLHESQIHFLAKTYQLEYQEICQKVWSEKKNIILISESQWDTKAKVFLNTNTEISPKRAPRERKINSVLKRWGQYQKKFTELVGEFKLTSLVKKFFNFLEIEKCVTKFC